MRLRSLKPQLAVAGSRLATLPPPRPNTVERKRGSAGVRDRERIRKRDCNLCQECKRHGRLGVVGAAVDHIQPLWAGGSDDETNKELLCQRCHDAKTAIEARQRVIGAWTPPNRLR